MTWNLRLGSGKTAPMYRYSLIRTVMYRFPTRTRRMTAGGTRDRPATDCATRSPDCATWPLPPMEGTELDGGPETLSNRNCNRDRLLRPPPNGGLAGARHPLLRWRDGLRSVRGEATRLARCLRAKRSKSDCQIVALGTLAADGSTRRWSTQEVIRAIEKTEKNKKKGKKEGDIFFTVDPENKKSRRKVIVQRFKCGKRLVHELVKSSPSIKSRKDDLNDLRRC